jgi:N-hydroxyarylamine O-acetyltransferase
LSDRLTAYLARLGLGQAPSADPAGLAAVQLAHRRAIPFENLDIHLGRGIRIDSDSVFDKLVTRRRGGYCFEQNRLYADMLTALGITSRPLLARVRLGLAADAHPPRTHVLLLAELAGESWIADAGFGGSYVPPLPLRDGAEAATPEGAHHRLRRLEAGLSGEWVLERTGPQAATDGRAQAHGDWQAQYSFDLAQVAPEDLEQANHWTSTRHGTRFTTLAVASIVLDDGFAALTERQVTVTRGRGSEASELADPARWREALANTFTIALDEEEVAGLPLWRSAVG